MPDDFEGLRPIYETPIFTLPEVEKEEIPTYKKLREEWKKTSSQRIKNSFNQWLKETGRDYSIVNPNDVVDWIADERDEILWGKLLPKSSKYKRNSLMEYMPNSRYEKDATEFRDWFVKKEQSRFNNLRENQKVIEQKFGGIYSATRENDIAYNLESFMRGGRRVLSLWTLKDTDRIYGDEYASNVSKGFYGAGEVTGNLILTLATMKLASVAGIAGKIMQVGTKSKIATNILRAVGKPKYMLGKLGNFKSLIGAVDSVAKYTTPEIAGALGITAGSIGAVLGVTQNTMNKLMEQDKLSVNQWLNGYTREDGTRVPGIGRAMYEGFLQKYFVGVINDPQSWGARFIGDAVYSTAEQLYQVLRGDRKELNLADLGINMGVSHLMGEAQGLAFSPSKNQMTLMFEKNKAGIYGNMVEQRLGIKMTDWEKFYIGNAIRGAEQKYKLITGKWFDSGQVSKLVDTTNVALEKGAFAIQRNSQYNDYRMNIADYTKEVKLSEDLAYEALKNNFRLSKEDVNKLKKVDIINDKDSKRFIQFLKGQGKYAIKPREKKIEPLSPNKAIRTKQIYDGISHDIKYIKPMDFDKFYNSIGGSIKNYNLIDKRTNEPYRIIDLFMRKQDYDWELEQRRAKANVPTKEEIEAQEREDLEIKRKEASASRKNADFKKWIREDPKNANIYNNLDKFIKGYVYGEYPRSQIMKEGIDDIASRTWEVFLKMGKTKTRDYDKILFRIAEIQTLEYYNKNIKRSKTTPLKVYRDDTGEERSADIADDRYAPESMSSYFFEKYGLYEAKEKAILTNMNSVLSEYANLKKDNIYPVLAFMLKHHQRGFEAGDKWNYQDIAEFFNDRNILLKEGQSWTKDMVKKRVENLVHAIHNKIQTGDFEEKKPWVRPKGTYTRNDINKSFKDIQNEKDVVVNKTSGVEKNIDDFVADNIKDNKAFVFDLNDSIAVRNRFGKNAGDLMVNRAIQLIINELSDIRTDWFNNRKDIVFSVRHPETENNNRLIVTHSGLSEDEFEQVGSYVQRVLTRNFDDVDIPDKRFAVTIRTPDNKEFVITNFKNTKISFIGDPSDVDKVDLPDFDVLDDIPLFKFSQNKVEKPFKESTEFEKRRETSKQIYDKADIDTFVGWIERQLDLGSDSETFNVMFKANAIVNEEKKGGVLNFLRNMKTSVQKAVDIYQGKDRSLKYGRYIQTLTKRLGFKNIASQESFNQVIKIHLENGFTTENINNAGIRAYDVFLKHIVEEEMKNLIGIRTDRKSPLYEKIKIIPKEIKGKRENFNFNIFKNNPNSADDDNAVLVHELTDWKNEKFPLAKILVQYYGINPKMLVDTITDLNNNIFAPLDELYRARVTGDNANFNLFNNVKNNIRKIIIDTTSNQLGLSKQDRAILKRKLGKVDFNNNEARKSFEEDYVSKIQDVTARGILDRALDEYELIDPKRMSYFHHRIIGDKENQKLFISEIQNYILNKPTIGKRVLSPVMREFRGRKFGIFRIASRRGYAYERSSLETIGGVLKYAYEKEANRIFANKYKETFINKFNIAYEEAVKNKDFAILEEFFKDVSGYFYMPALTELGLLKKQIKSLEKNIKLAQRSGFKNGEQAKQYIESSGENLIKLKEYSKNVIRLLKTYEGTDNGLRNATKLSQSDIRNKIASALFGDKEQIYMPANVKSFINHRKKAGKAFGIYFTQVQSQRGKLLAPDIDNFDGVYFDTFMHNVFSNLVFKNDYLRNSYGDDIFHKVLKQYDNLNKIGKQIMLYKPTIIFANDLVQQYLADPKAVVYMPYGFKAVRHASTRVNAKKYYDLRDALKETERKYGVKSAQRLKAQEKLEQFLKENPGHFYNIAQDHNLLNDDMSIGDVYSKIHEISLEMVGRNNFIGAVAEELTGDRQLFIKQALSAIKMGARGYKNMAWYLDKVTRVATMKSMFDRFIKIHDFDTATYLSAKWANQFHAEYERMPIATRRGLNRLFFVPNFKFQTAHLYAQMIKRFGQGAMRLATGRIIGEQPFIVSENRYRQALFEMSPLLRKVATVAGLKILLSQVFGYQWDDIWDFIRGYRLKKRRGGDPYTSDIEYVSFATPLFEYERILSRPISLTARYFASPMLGFAWTLATGRNRITGKPMMTTDPRSNPIKAKWEVGLGILQQYFPWGSEFTSWRAGDINSAKYVFNLFGLGYFYNTQSPEKLMKDYLDATDRTLTIGERIKRQRKLYRDLKNAYQIHFKKDFKNIYEQLKENDDNIRGIEY